MKTKPNQRKGAKAQGRALSATVAVKFSGAASRWKKGERVKARYIGGDFFIIEREKWKGQLPIQNQCFMVPKSFLNFAPLRPLRLCVKSPAKSRS